MDLIPVIDVLEGIASEIVPQVLQWTGPGPIGDFWRREALRMDYERRISEAARLLNQALHYAESPPRWARYDDERKFSVFDDGATQEGFEILKYVTSWVDRQRQRRESHVLLCDETGLNPFTEDMFHDIDNDNMAPGRLWFFRVRALQFEREPLIAMLDAAGIEHDLVAEEAGDAVRAVNSPERQSPPGKIPVKAAPMLAVKAAWEIEQETGTRATRSEVMERLRRWATDGTYADILVRADMNSVIWYTVRGDEKSFGRDACSKVLQRWYASRPG